MNKQITILVNKINRLKVYVNNHKLHLNKVSQLFDKFEDSICYFEHFLNRDVKDPDNIPLEQKEWHDRIGDTSEINGLTNMDAYDRQQVFGDNYEQNIDRLNVLYSQGIKHYIIRDGKLEALTQDDLSNFVDNFTIKEYFPNVVQ